MRAIRELKANERENYDLLLTGVKEVQGRNGSFCVLTFRPGKNERQIEARMWKCTREKVLELTPEMTVVNVFLTGNEYNGELGYIADTMVPANGKAADEFLQTGRASGKEMYAYIVRLIEKNCMDHAAAVPALNLLREHEKELIEWPAAMRVHHAYKGGLASHLGACAGACIKAASVISPASVSAIRKKDTKSILNCIYRGISSRTKGPLTELAKSILKKCTVSPIHDNVIEKALTMLLADRISKCYPFLDTDLLYAAIALRGCSIFSGNDLAQVIGVPAADAQIIADEAGDKKDSEAVRMLIHCVLVDNTNDRRAAIPEAFLAHELGKVARLAAENADAGKLDASCMAIAAAVHDIGKLKELSSDGYGNADYQVDGNLFGHTQIGIRMLIQEAVKCGVDASSIGDVLHCMASHHGKAEWGALMPPASYEAKVVAAFDYIDSRLDIFDTCAKALQEGEKDESVRKYTGNIVYRRLPG